MSVKQKPYSITIQCSCCKGKGKIRNGENRPMECPYCHGAGTRDEPAPHPSHKMTDWQSEIRCPCDTPRFYSVRTCSVCGQEEMRHAAGRFMERLRFECDGEGK